MSRLFKKGEIGIVPILGIAIPFLIIIFVASTSVLDIGVTIRESYPTKIFASELFESRNSSERYDYSEIPAGPVVKTIEVENNFIFQRRVPIDILVCYDSNGGRRDWTRVLYIDGERSINSDYVQVGPRESKKIELRLMKNVYYDNYMRQDAPEEINLYQMNSAYRRGCYSLDENAKIEKTILVE
jgi:hypothetical protein